MSTAAVLIVDSLVLEGYHRVLTGAAYAGDKYYDVVLGAWLPVTVNQGTEVEDYYAVIRRKER